ncbi:hypothetical protein [Frankia tisae]|uniref:hypothetical protein n=1 Tax=Frankia tisae TaxID=2950104 RepID=UPI0021C0099A|nr:hypothetical protein [Frankia tisae]
MATGAPSDDVAAALADASALRRVDAEDLADLLRQPPAASITTLPAESRSDRPDETHRATGLSLQEPEGAPPLPPGHPARPVSVPTV